MSAGTSQIAPADEEKSRSTAVTVATPSGPPAFQTKGEMVGNTMVYQMLPPVCSNETAGEDEEGFRNDEGVDDRDARDFTVGKNKTLTTGHATGGGEGIESGDQNAVTTMTQKEFDELVAVGKREDQLLVANHESRAALEKQMNRVTEELREAVRRQDFAAATELQNDYDELERVRQTLPSLEELQNMAKDFRRDLQRAHNMKEFADSISGRLNEQILRVEECIRREGKPKLTVGNTTEVSALSSDGEIAEGGATPPSPVVTPTKSPTHEGENTREGASGRQNDDNPDETASLITLPTDNFEAGRMNANVSGQTASTGSLAQHPEVAGTMDAPTAAAAVRDIESGMPQGLSSSGAMLERPIYTERQMFRIMIAFAGSIFLTAVCVFLITKYS